MIEITDLVISPDRVIGRAKTPQSGCVVAYIGLIRDRSCGKDVAGVEYTDPDGTALSILQQIEEEASERWPVNCIAVCHRIGQLKVGDINLVVAVAATHRKEGAECSRFIIDCFKERVPTHKKEAYLDGSTHITEG